MFFDSYSVFALQPFVTSGPWFTLNTPKGYFVRSEGLASRPWQRRRNHPVPPNQSRCHGEAAPVAPHVVYAGRFERAARGASKIASYLLRSWVLFCTTVALPLR